MIYGEEGEYYALSKKCYKYISPTYVYELCPYHKATQDDGQKPDPVKLGKDGVLDLSDKNKPKVTNFRFSRNSSKFSSLCRVVMVAGARIIKVAVLKFTLYAELLMKSPMSRNPRLVSIDLISPHQQPALPHRRPHSIT